jgi:ABC-type cobalamin/Fe3+-siderophores transport system ATPase subunit
MILSKLIIENYKSYFSATAFDFTSGFNVLLGANSSGKTTVLEAIRLSDFQSVPHRSLVNIVESDTPWTRPSTIVTHFEMTLSELRKIMLPSGLSVLLSNSNGQLMDNIGKIEEWWTNKHFGIGFQTSGGGTVQSFFLPVGRKSALRQAHYNGGHWWATITPDGIDWPQHAVQRGGDNLHDITHVAQRINDKIYRFSAERVVRATCRPSTPDLAPDASNLAFCINHLRSSDRYTFDLLTKFINRIFPNIYDISSVADANANFGLSVHTVPQEKRRSDLAISMDKVGTGVSNAVAMLYVVLTSKTQRIILLEEPNSYLHPRALRELLAILAEAGSQHQFFITTHSSDVLRSISASTVTLLENDGSQTKVKQTHSAGLSIFTAGLLDLGIRLTDLHGCDRVLWVEGETEEAIFPKLLAHFFPSIAQGIATLRLHATGDFEAKRIKPGKVAEIYRRLSQATFLAPPMVAITLDREGKNQQQVDSMMKECAGIVYLLPRPMVEDYLLVPGAIEALISGKYASVTIQQVEISLATAKASRENWLWPSHPTDDTVHAAKVLHCVFSELGGDGAGYDKAQHGPLLAQWILDHDPDHFQPLHAWMKEFIK